MRSIGFDFGSVYTKGVLLDEQLRPELTLYCRKERGDRAAIGVFLDEIHGRYPNERLGCGLASNALIAIGRGVRLIDSAVRSVIEIGGQTSKFLLLGDDGEPVDFATNEACAAGTGSFLEQQARRLELSIEELSALSAEAKSGATVAGRCAVFAKSDMIHLQQKGTPVAEIAYGLCLAICRNALTTLLKGRDVVAPVMIAGGCAQNAGVIRAFGEILSTEVLQSPYPGLEGAIGAAAAGTTSLDIEQIRDLVATTLAESTPRRATLQPLVRVSAERRAEPEAIREEHVEAFLGIDVGSVSTDLVLLDRRGVLLSSVYLPTRGRPVDVLRDGLAMLLSRFRGGLTIAGCGTTGSGRHLAARLIGADVVKNEITCQALGARAYVPDADTILEIGGQDSKFISLRNGAISDFAMNKICAAGTGSFLEEQAREMGVEIIGDFSRRAFSAAAPLDLGTRCTVFMETEVVSALHEGANRDDVCAGLAHSIVKNYLEKVVGTRRIGNSVVFQGGVASNDAVVAAFECTLGRPVHVHPYNRISGAIGAAIAAINAAKDKSEFHTISADSRPSLKSFECRQCSNRCEVNVVRVAKELAFFGDTCERYTNRSSVAQESDLPPNLAEEYVQRCEAAFDSCHDMQSPLTIGIPRASIVFDAPVFWATFFRMLGHRPVLSAPSSEETLRSGLKHLAVGVCLPIKLTAGHVHTLLERGVDFVFLPSVIHLPGQDPSQSHPCPYTMAVPFMIKVDGRLLSPVISLRDENAFLDGFAACSDVLGVTRADMQRAWREAWRAQKELDDEFAQRARDLLDERRFRHAFAILGKPYNTFDGWLNLSLFERLRRKGILAIPQKFLPLQSDDPATAFPWRYSTDMSSTAEFLAASGDLRPVIVSNFGCGPDAFAVRQIEETLRDTPHLFLEFDEHRGEAGVMTRIEAFVDQIEADAGRPAKVTSAERDRFAADTIPPPGSIVRIPYFADHAYAFSGVLRFLGCDAAVLPPPTPAIRALGERWSLGKECHAYSMIAGDLIELSRRSDGERVTFYFPGTSLPCLLHEYGRGLRLLLRDIGDGNITVSTPTGADLMRACTLEGLERFYVGLFSIELLVKAVCQIRPYEREKGRADAVHRRNLERIESSIVEGNVLAALDASLSDLSAIPIERRGDRPIVGLSGDIYTKTNAVANDDLFRWLESRGVEVWPSPFQIDLVDFGISRGLSRSLESLDLPNLLLNGSLAVRRAIHQWRIHHVVNGRVRNEEEPGYLQMRKLTARYMPNDSHDLLFINVSKIADFAQRGADGIINAICFNCMVGNASTAIIEKIRGDYGGLPIMSAVYAGEDDPSRRMALEAFVSQVIAHHRRRTAATPPAGNGRSWFPALGRPRRSP